MGQDCQFLLTPYHERRSNAAFGSVLLVQLCGLSIGIEFSVSQCTNPHMDLEVGHEFVLTVPFGQFSRCRKVACLRAAHFVVRVENPDRD
jgi:hypothetical protein